MLANIARQSTGAIVEPADPTVWTSSKCWHFTDSYIYKEFDVIEPLFPASDNFTYSFWVYLNNLGYGGGAGENILCFKAAGISQNLVGSIKQTRIYTGQNSLKIYSSNNGWSHESINIEVGSWKNITLTGTDVSSNAFKIYLDGSLVASDENGSNDFSMNPSAVAPFKFQIGYYPDSSYVPPSFYMSELGVWDVALDAAAVAVIGATPINWNSNSGSYDNENDLVAYYRFGDGVGDNPASLLHDETNGDHVTVSESAGFRDLTNIIGTINQVNTTSVGNYPTNQSS